MSTSATSSSGPHKSAMGTPSKSKTGNFFHRENSPARKHTTTSTGSAWKTVRWILLGFGIGAATMALFHSVNMPTIRVQLAYDDAPALLPHQQQRHHKNAFLIESKGAAVRLNANKIQQQQEEELEEPQPVQQQEETELQRENDSENENDNENEAANDNEEDSQAEDADADTADNADSNADTADNDPDDGPEDPDADNTDPDSVVDAEGNTQILIKGGGNSTTNSSKLYVGEMEVEEDDPDFSNPGPPPKLAAGEAFAACILIKDDNHWLIEWLAYHYHVMPLRYLIVAIDPDSKTSPIPILKRWKDRKLMTISIWDDKMFMPSKIKANAGIFNNNTELMMHRVRQNNFYFKCMRTFKQRNREWLMLIDTDEYIVTNYASGLYHNLTKNIPITRPGNVLTFIKQHHEMTGENHTCSYMPRYMFGTKESDTAMVQRHMPPGLDGMDFLTQRFLYRNPRRMHNGKNLINIRKLPQIKTYTSVHHVSSYCPDPDKMRTVNHVKKALVRVHHYLGTEEQYFFRSDPRDASKNASAPVTKTKEGHVAVAFFTRGKGRYQMLNKRALYADQGARAWIRGFIADVGLERAKELLEGVGQVGYE